jgi:hypothetical protein
MRTASAGDVQQSPDEEHGHDDNGEKQKQLWHRT